MDVATRVMRWIIGEAEALPPALLREAPELATVRWRRGGVFPRVAGLALGQRTVAAITLWRTVFLGRRTQPSLELLLHEVRHVHQFQASRAFPAAYLWESVRRGYHQNRFERDACAYAQSRLQTLRSLRRPGDD